MLEHEAVLTEYFQITKQLHSSLDEILEWSSSMAHKESIVPVCFGDIIVIHIGNKTKGKISFLGWIEKKKKTLQNFVLVLQ